MGKKFLLLKLNFMVKNNNIYINNSVFIENIHTGNKISIFQTPQPIFLYRRVNELYMIYIYGVGEVSYFCNLL